MRVVLDTNVIISALNFPGNERLVLELALRGRFEFYLSRSILEAAAGVLVRKFGWDEERTAQAIRVIGNAAIGIEPLVSEPLRLPEAIEGGHADNRVLELRGSRQSRLPRYGRPAASLAHWGTSRHENCQRSPFPVGAGAGPVEGGRPPTPTSDNCLLITFSWIFGAYKISMISGIMLPDEPEKLPRIEWCS